MRPAEDLARSSFGLGARIACWCGATRPLAACDYRLVLITTPRITTEQKREERRDSCGLGLVRKSQGEVPQFQPGTLNAAIHFSNEWIQVELA